MEENKVKEQKDFDILNKMKNLPGGLVIIPLVIAVVLATFVPQVFQIGGYVTALFYEGNACMMGFFLDCMWIYDQHQAGRYASLQRCDYDRNQIPPRSCDRTFGRKALWTGRILRNRTICTDCNYYELQRIPVHFPVLSVR